MAQLQNAPFTPPANTGNSLSGALSSALGAALPALPSAPTAGAALGVAASAVALATSPNLANTAVLAAGAGSLFGGLVLPKSATDLTQSALKVAVVAGLLLARKSTEEVAADRRAEHEKREKEAVEKKLADEKLLKAEAERQQKLAETKAALASEALNRDERNTRAEHMAPADRERLRRLEKRYASEPAEKIYKPRID